MMVPLETSGTIYRTARSFSFSILISDRCPLLPWRHRV